MHAFFQAKFEKLCDKLIPKLVRGIFTPLLVLLVVIPVSLIVIGPVTGVIGDVLVRCDPESFAGSTGSGRICICGIVAGDDYLWCPLGIYSDRYEQLCSAGV